MEIWKPVIGFEDFYHISSFGRLKSLQRTVLRKNGYPLNLSEKIIKLHPDKKGYLRYRLHGGGRAKTCKIHRLVAEVFIENNSDHPQVNHKNGDKADNRVCNLEWCSNEYNCKHATEVLKVNRASKEKMFSDTEVMAIRTFPPSNSTKTIGYTAEELAEAFGCSRSTIYKIRRNEIYKW